MARIEENISNMRYHAACVRRAAPRRAPSYALSINNNKRHNNERRAQHGGAQHRRLRHG
jgi:hypothetical protein